MCEWCGCVSGMGVSGVGSYPLTRETQVCEWCGCVSGVGV